MNVKIRALEQKDFDAIAEIHAAERAYSGTLQLPYPSKIYWRKRLEGMSSNDHILIAEIDGEVVGNILLKSHDNPRRRHSGYLAMAVVDEWQGKGIGNRLMCAAIDLADNWLNLVRIELEVFSDNQAAIALYERWGFVKEGIARKYAFKNGAYQDAIYMARIASDLNKSMQSTADAAPD